MEQRRDGGGPTLLGGVKEVGGVGHPRASTLAPRVSESPADRPVPFDPIFANQPPPLPVPKDLPSSSPAYRSSSLPTRDQAPREPSASVGVPSDRRFRENSKSPGRLAAAGSR